jgi:hypothetical protein
MFLLLLTATLNEAGLLLQPPSSRNKEFVVKRMCECRVELQKRLKERSEFLTALTTEYCPEECDIL